MAEEKRSLLQRLKYWLFGKREEHRADQKERRDELSGFMKDRADEKEEREAAAREDGD
jgi:hypothetical protein